MLGSIGGVFFGNEQLWRFDDGTPGTDYTTLFNTQARIDAGRQAAFFKAKPWHRLIPSGLGGMGTLITVGGGTAIPQSTTYVAAACTAAGDLLCAYMPPSHSGTLTVDMTKLAGTAIARWFDPTNATFTAIGAFVNTGTRVFTRPGNNSAGDGDFLLVLETSSGQATITVSASAVGAAVVDVVGVATIAIAAQGVGASIALAAGSASFALAAAAVSGTVIQCVGSAAFAVAASAVGARTVTAAGSASFATSAVGAAAATAATTGAATIAVLATAEGNSTGEGPAAGAASMTITATAIGAALAASVGTSAIAFTAIAIPVSVGGDVQLTAFGELVSEMDRIVIELLG